MTAIRSCEVSAAQLRAWGFPVAGHHITHDEWLKGDDIWVARRKALKAGLVVESHWEDDERTWVGTCKVTDDNRVKGQELVAWFAAEGRIRT